MRHGVDHTLEPCVPGQSRDRGEAAVIGECPSRWRVLGDGGHGSVDLFGEWPFETLVVGNGLSGAGASLTSAVADDAQVGFGELEVRDSCEQQRAADREVLSADEATGPQQFGRLGVATGRIQVPDEVVLDRGQGGDRCWRCHVLAIALVVGEFQTLLEVQLLRLVADAEVDLITMCPVESFARFDLQEDQVVVLAG